jgi:hypothetical protein
VLLVGGGVTWIPGSAWRLNYWYKMYAREMPWLRALPSDYFCKHFSVATYQIEKSASPERLARALGTLPEIESMLIYASGFASADVSEPADIAARLPGEWHERVFAGNALDFFRWPDRERSAAPAGVSGEALLEMSTRV